MLSKCSLLLLLFTRNININFLFYSHISGGISEAFGFVHLA